MLLLSSVYTGGNQGTERLSNLLEATQLVKRQDLNPGREAPEHSCCVLSRCHPADDSFLPTNRSLQNQVSQRLGEHFSLTGKHTLIPRHHRCV